MEARETIPLSHTMDITFWTEVKGMTFFMA